jgi:1-acyl-sn-glycerol-3-phosphate acyltransferase
MAARSLAFAPMRSEWDGWTRGGRYGVEAVFRAGFRMRFVGLEHIPEAGGALLTYNHVSVLDPLMVGLGAARRGRPVRFLVLTDDYERPVVGWTFRRTRQIPIKRGLGDWTAIEQVAEVLRGGQLAGMAPEGTVGLGGEIQAGKRGAARIALSAGVPVVPVGIWGTNERWGKHGPSWELRRPAAAAVFGPPIVADGGPRSIPDTSRMTERIMAGIAEVASRARAEAALVSGPRGTVP